MKIIRGELTANDVVPPATRYDVTCNCIQVTPDGGTTWQEAIGADPRTQPAYLKPPVGGSSKRCDAAANMTKYIHDIVDSFIADLTGGATELLLANDLLTFIEQIFPFAAYFLQLMFELAVDVLATGASDLNTAFDSTTYDDLLCIFFCHADSSGTISPAALTQIEAQIVSQLNTTAALIVNEILFITGDVGISNAGAIGSQTGDCSGCPDADFCHIWSPTKTTLDEWGHTSGDMGEFLGGIWIGVGDSPDGTQNVIISRAIPIPVTINTITTTTTNHDNNGNRPTLLLYLSGVQVARLDSTSAAHSVQNSAEETFDFGGVVADKITIGNLADVTGTYVSIEAIEVTGSGGCGIFGIDNC